MIQQEINQTRSSYEYLYFSFSNQAILTLTVKITDEKYME